MGEHCKITTCEDPSTYDYSVYGKKNLGIDEVVELLKMPQKYRLEGCELDLQHNFVDNLMDICKGLNLCPPKYVFEQKRYDSECIGFSIITDVIVKHTDNTLTIFERKKASKNHPHTGPVEQMKGIGQCLLYKNVYEALMESPVRVALVDEKIHPRTFLAFSGFKLPITLIEYQYDHVFVPYNGW